VVRELLAADRRRAVVVMGHEAKEAMEERLREALGEELQRGARWVLYSTVLCNTVLVSYSAVVVYRSLQRSSVTTGLLLQYCCCTYFYCSSPADWYLNSTITLRGLSLVSSGGGEDGDPLVLEDWEHRTALYCTVLEHSPIYCTVLYCPSPSGGGEDR